MSGGTPQNFKDMRKHVRVDSDFEIHLRLEGGSVVTSRMGNIVAKGKNISEGGLYMELPKKEMTDRRSAAVDNFLLFKSVLVMDVNLPGEAENVHAKGKAVWIEKETPGQPYQHGVAVCFTELDERSRTIIRRFVSLHV